MSMEKQEKVLNTILEVSIVCVIIAIIFTILSTYKANNVEETNKKNNEDITKNEGIENAYLITNSTKFTYVDKDNSDSLKLLKDEDYKTYINVDKDTTIELNNSIPIKSLYIIYELKGYKATLEYDTENMEIGTNNFIHEYVELPKEANDIKIKYSEDAIITDIYVFTKGKVPDYIQKWEINDENADLLLFSTHSDDEHLMFAGIIPTYTAKGYKVQVAYMTNHAEKGQIRYHETLDGLWTANVKYYPELGPFPDQHSHGIKTALKKLKNIGLEQEDIINWQVQTIRKYKPSVVVGHGENGEYGHGQHILNSKSLEQAVEKTNDKEYTTKEYNTPWDVKKTYIHLYEKNPVVIDIDTPLEYYNGLSAFQVSQLAFKQHITQMKSGWVYKWLCGTTDNEITNSSQITKYFPNRYGLYRTTVGEDQNKNDFFENIK